MALSATFVSKVKHTGAPAGDKHTDGAGLHLLVNAVGKYWRLNYRFEGKQKTLALGVYPTITLEDARTRREAAKRLLAHGTDPSKAKAEEKKARLKAVSHSFEAVARSWLIKTAPKRAATTQEKNTNWLERNIFPVIGTMPIADIGPRDVLAALEKIEARGAVESAHKIKQLCGQIFRFAVATGLSDRDVTADLRGALAEIPRNHCAAITEPDAAGALLRSIDGYTGHPYAVTALKLAPMVFVRPGELRAAEWAEIDLEKAEWRIPAEKMKMRSDHLVPLARQAVALLSAMQPSGLDEHERMIAFAAANAILRGLVR